MSSIRVGNGVSETTEVERISSLLAMLATDLVKNELGSQVRLDLLQQMKVFSREASGSHLLCTSSGIELLTAYAFDTETVEVSREAIRCLANCLFLNEPARQVFVNLQGPAKTCRLYKSNSVEDEFLSARILLICTYGTDLDLEVLLGDHALSESMCNALHRHSDDLLQVDDSDGYTRSEMQDVALQETLKLLFNVTHFAPRKIELFNSCKQDLFVILQHQRLSSPPLRPPINQVINALLNFDLNEDVENVSTKHVLKAVAVRLLDILELSLEFMYENSENDFESSGASLLSLLRLVFEAAPHEVKSHIQTKLLPTPEERDRPLGRSNTLSARLLNLTTSALLPNCRKITSELLFTLSGCDPYVFIRNIGYGYASGFLMSNNIAIPENALKEDAHVHHENERATAINPVTGQTLEAEAQSRPDIPEMTEDEKLREAERLFVLFERLKNTGVVQIQNPVEAALQSGRFEELD